MIFLECIAKIPQCHLSFLYFFLCFRLREKLAQVAHPKQLVPNDPRTVRGSVRRMAKSNRSSPPQSTIPPLGSHHMHSGASPGRAPSLSGGSSPIHTVKSMVSASALIRHVDYAPEMQCWIVLPLVSQRCFVVGNAFRSFLHYSGSHYRYFIIFSHSSAAVWMVQGRAGSVTRGNHISDIKGRIAFRKYSWFSESNAIVFVRLAMQALFYALNPFPGHT